MVSASVKSIQEYHGRTGWTESELCSYDESTVQPERLVWQPDTPDAGKLEEGAELRSVAGCHQHAAVPGALTLNVQHARMLDRYEHTCNMLPSFCVQINCENVSR